MQNTNLKKEGNMNLLRKEKEKKPRPMKYTQWLKNDELSLSITHLFSVSPQSCIDVICADYLYLWSLFNGLEATWPLFIFSSFHEGSIAGSWNSSGFRASAKSGNVGAVSTILLFVDFTVLNYRCGFFLLQK